MLISLPHEHTTHASLAAANKKTNNAAAQPAGAKAGADGLVDKLDLLSLAGPKPKAENVALLRKIEAPRSILPRKIKAQQMSVKQRKVLMNELSTIKSAKAQGLLKNPAILTGREDFKEPSMLVSFDADNKKQVRIKGNTVGKGAQVAFSLVVDQAGKLGGVKVYRTSERKEKDDNKLAARRAALRAQGRRTEALQVKLKTGPVDMAAFKEENALLELVDSKVKVRDSFRLNGRLLAFTDVMQNELFDLAVEPLSIQERRDLTLSAFIQTTARLCEYHKRGIIHRDVKLENVLYHKDGTLEVSDLGLAKRVDAQGRARGGVGTPAYVAQEVLKGFSYDARADVYSLGILLSMLATGEAIYPNGNDIQEAQKFWQFHRSARRGADGRIDLDDLQPQLNHQFDHDRWNKFSASEQGFRNFFDEMHDLDRAAGSNLCGFILNDMLHPDIDKRATMQQCADFAQQLLAKDPKIMVRAADITKEFAARDPRNESEQVLRAYAKAFLTEA